MRLVTRSDFDGLMCAVLLKEVETIETIIFTHPKDIQDGKVLITSNDILTNLPYDPNCGMWFDHHSSEEGRLNSGQEFKGALQMAPSAARVVYDYYQNENLSKYEDVLDAVDRIDSAQLSLDDVTNPQNWILLGFLMDPRTGLGKYHHYRISNYQLMEQMIEWIPVHPVGEILEFPDVQERVEIYYDLQEEFREFLQKHSRQEQNVLVTDFRGLTDMPSGNRFLVYTLFPKANVSMQIMDGFKKQNVVVAVGYSIFNRTCQTDIGKLMRQYKGGGHKAVGTCQLRIEDAQTQIEAIIQTLKTA